MREEGTKTQTKTTFTYNDLVEASSGAGYSTIGKVIVSQKPSAPSAVFGTAEKKHQDKLLAEEPFMKVITGGR